MAPSLDIVRVLFPVLAMIPPLAMVGVIAFTVVYSQKPIPTPAPAAHGQPLTFHAHLFRPHEQFSIGRQLDTTTYGHLTVDPTGIYWHPNGGAPWSAPIGALTVTATHGVFSFSAPSVDVHIDGSGPWRIVASNRTINRFVKNDFKKFRESRTAAFLAQHLIALGARTTAVV